MKTIRLDWCVVFMRGHVAALDENLFAERDAN